MKDGVVYKVFDHELESKIEFNRQRQFLECSVNDLQITVKKVDAKRESNFLVMDENLKLIDDINVSRKNAATYLSKYEALKFDHPKKDNNVNNDKKN